MKIRTEIGNRDTKEWEDPFFIDLAPYSRIFAVEYPDLPTYPGIDDTMAIKDYSVDILGQTSVEVTVYHHVPNNAVSIFIKHEGQSFVQVMGEACNSNGVGLSLLIQAPGTNVPVNFTCEP